MVTIVSEPIVKKRDTDKDVQLLAGCETMEAIIAKAAGKQLSVVALSLAIDRVVGG